MRTAPLRGQDIITYPRVTEHGAPMLVRVSVVDAIADILGCEPIRVPTAEEKAIRAAFERALVEGGNAYLDRMDELRSLVQERQ